MSYELVTVDQVLSPRGISIIDNAKLIVLPSGKEGDIKEIFLSNLNLHTTMYYNVTEKLIISYKNVYNKLLYTSGKWVIA